MISDTIQFNKRVPGNVAITASLPLPVGATAKFALMKNKKIRCPIAENLGRPDLKTYRHHGAAARRPRAESVLLRS